MEETSGKTRENGWKKEEKSGRSQSRIKEKQGNGEESTTMN